MMAQQDPIANTAIPLVDCGLKRQPITSEDFTEGAAALKITGFFPLNSFQNQNNNHATVLGHS
jgi:hypothetical protein